ncbi:ABC transporter permease [Pseudoroseomonas deserti]|uniref:ABC transporter permease n=1 Tax=Teichococcus deserti TaxID=1817963 RepID=A0A1V2H0Z9_9PROT|nr:ABC transporter permease [Pseudoroseomonas deserti]ONG52614.1 ABC transporter permease [Pseudoroseomonas deserti]
MAVLRQAGKRLVQAVPVLFGVVAVNFLLMQAAPGDLADVLAGEQGAATPEMMAELRARFGLDQPVWVQFAHYLGNLLTGDFGYSHRLGLPVLTLILERLPATLLLMLPAVFLAAGSGMVLGGWAARRAGTWLDGLISVGVLIAYATPLFWAGLMAIVVFAVQLQWLPVGGMRDPSAAYTGLAMAGDVARHMVLPVCSLALFYAALYARLMRASMLSALQQDYIRTARAKGLSPFQVEAVHAGRNALLPVLTMVGLQAGSLIGGAVLVETVFSWPGLGRLAFDAILRRDLNLLLGIVLVSSMTVILVNFVVDLLYGLADPRVRAA